MGEAEMTLFLGAFLCLVAMVRASFPQPGRFRGELIDWPWPLLGNPLAKEASRDSALPSFRAWAELCLSGRQDQL